MGSFDIQNSAFNIRHLLQLLIIDPSLTFRARIFFTPHALRFTIYLQPNRLPPSVFLPMSLSARQDPLFGRAGAGEFSTAALAAVLQAGAPEIAFAHLLGSARDGKLSSGADVDLAVWLIAGEHDWDTLSKIITLAEDFCGVRCDLGVLNHAGVVYRFEALRGRRLLVRSGQWDRYGDFFSGTCFEHGDFRWRLQRHRQLRRELRLAAAG